MSQRGRALLDARKLVPGDAKRIGPAFLEARRTTLAAINESCVVFEAAFLLLAGIWAFVGLVLLVVRRRKT